MLPWTTTSKAWVFKIVFPPYLIDNNSMKNKEYLINLIMVGLLSLSFSAAAVVGTVAYYRHLAVIHHAAFYESDSWGHATFHWNDVSFAQAPFKN